MVGSGNLTYAGHGGSLEVFEVLRPQLHSLAYAQAAAFFGDLLNIGKDRVDIGETTEPLEGLQRRMSSLSGKYANVEDVQFIHCLRESGLQQLVREVPNKKIDELLVLSPYHHPEGEPIRSLVQAFRPKALAIAVDASEKTSAFPFEISEEWGLPVRAVVAEPSIKRSVHAKWYEWRSQGKATLFTGSFNATMESLTTTNNIECGVLRRDASPSENWIDTESPPFRKQPFPRTNQAGGAIVTASLSGISLSGKFLGKIRQIPRDWTFKLQITGLPATSEQEITIAEDGSFKSSLEKRIDVDQENAVQILMESGVFRARGWVSLPQLLHIGAQRRSLLSSLGPIDRGSESTAGFAELLAIVMDEIRSFTSVPPPVLNTTSSQPKKPSAENPSNNDASSTGAPRAEIVDRPSFGSGSSRDRLLEALANGQSGWAVWGKMAHVFLGLPIDTQVDTPPEKSGNKKRSSRPPRDPIVHPPLDDDIDPTAYDEEKNALVEMLSHFDLLIENCREELKRQLSRSEITAEERSQILLNLANLERTWLHLTLRAYVGPIDDAPVAFQKIGEWLHSAVDIAFTGPSQELMLFEYAGCSSILAYQNAARPDALTEALAQLQSSTTPVPKSVRAVQYLEAAFGGSPDIERILDLAVDWLNSQVGHALVRGEVEQALTALARSLAQPTPRSQVARYFKDRPIVSDVKEWYPLNPTMLDLLRRAAQPKIGRKSFGAVDVRTILGCPVCYQDLRTTSSGQDVKRPDPTLLAQLKLFCVAACPRCQAPLINHIAVSE
ncbi:hypothetical protein DXT88_05895 [Herbaspirillum lusitanum]|nr:hypothetical protein [Herbaspirillum lusitanum]